MSEDNRLVENLGDERRRQIARELFIQYNPELERGENIREIPRNLNAAGAIRPLTTGEENYNAFLDNMRAIITDLGVGNTNNDILDFFTNAADNIFNAVNTGEYTEQQDENLIQRSFFNNSENKGIVIATREMLRYMFPFVQNRERNTAIRYYIYENESYIVNRYFYIDEEPNDTRIYTLIIFSVMRIYRDTYFTPGSRNITALGLRDVAANVRLLVNRPREAKSAQTIIRLESNAPPPTYDENERKLEEEEELEKNVRVIPTMTPNQLVEQVLQATTDEESMAFMIDRLSDRLGIIPRDDLVIVEAELNDRIEQLTQQLEEARDQLNNLANIEREYQTVQQRIGELEGEINQERLALERDLEAANLEATLARQDRMQQLEVMRTREIQYQANLEEMLAMDRRINADAAETDRLLRLQIQGLARELARTEEEYEQVRDRMYQQMARANTATDRVTILEQEVEQNQVRVTALQQAVLEDNQLRIAVGLPVSGGPNYIPLPPNRIIPPDNESTRLRNLIQQYQDDRNPYTLDRLKRLLQQIINRDAVAVLNDETMNFIQQLAGQIVGIPRGPGNVVNPQLVMNILNNIPVDNQLLQAEIVNIVQQSTSNIRAIMAGILLSAAGIVVMETYLEAMVNKMLIITGMTMPSIPMINTGVSEIIGEIDNTIPSVDEIYNQIVELTSQISLTPVPNDYIVDMDDRPFIAPIAINKLYVKNSDGQWILYIDQRQSIIPEPIISTTYGKLLQAQVEGELVEIAISGYAVNPVALEIDQELYQEIYANVKKIIAPTANIQVYEPTYFINLFTDEEIVSGNAMIANSDFDGFMKMVKKTLDVPENRNAIKNFIFQVQLKDPLPGGGPPDDDPDDDGDYSGDFGDKIPDKKDVDNFIKSTAGLVFISSALMYFITLRFKLSLFKLVLGTGILVGGIVAIYPPLTYMIITIIEYICNMYGIPVSQSILDIKQSVAEKTEQVVKLASNISGAAVDAATTIASVGAKLIEATNKAFDVYNSLPGGTIIAVGVIGLIALGIYFGQSKEVKFSLF